MKEVVEAPDMAERTCDCCKHYHPNGKGYGQCFRWHGGNGEGGYSTPMERVAENEVVVETDEGWGALMGPKFGCVLWETVPGAPT